MFPGCAQYHLPALRYRRMTRQMDGANQLIDRGNRALPG